MLVVRILTVLNDNLARWLVIGLGKRAALAVGASEAAVRVLHKPVRPAVLRQCMLQALEKR